MGSSGSLAEGKVFGAVGASWRLHLTGDGSPSFSEAKSEGRTELMHHSGGAFSETLYIYGPGVEKAFQLLVSPRVMSLGLGLGYNEILVAGQALKSGKTKDFFLQSFESDSFLRGEFLRFIQGAEDRFGMREIYHEICRRFEVSPREICEILSVAYHEERFRLDPALTDALQILNGVHVFLWDAFSQKTTPELWTEDFLKQSLGLGSADTWLATYACNAALKGALRASDLEVVIRPGFQGKRECTWGRGGVFVGAD